MQVSKPGCKCNELYFGFFWFTVVVVMLPLGTGPRGQVEPMLSCKLVWSHIRL